jgi:hypothetical protein
MTTATKRQRSLSGTFTITFTKNAWRYLPLYPTSAYNYRQLTVSVEPSQPELEIYRRIYTGYRYWSPLIWIDV